MTRSDLSRRSFIRLAGLGALSLGAGLGRAPEALAAGLKGDLKIFRRSRLMMGTYVTLTLVDDSLIRAEEAVERTFAEMARLEGILTRYDQSAPLAELAARGRLNSPRPELVAVLEAAAGFHALSGGAFDVSVAPVIDATKAAFEAAGRPLDEAELARLMARVDGRAIQVGRNRIELKKEGMALTLDGLAKGYIVDRAAESLRGQGVRQALINAGGDIYALGSKGPAPWRVAVVDPTRPAGRGPILGLSNRAIATSGNYQVYWDKEKLHHHIVSPGDGHSPSGPVSVSIQAADCLRADALSTTLFCLPPEQGLALLKGQGAEGLIINRQGQRLSRGAWG